MKLVQILSALTIVLLAAFLGASGAETRAGGANGVRSNTTSRQARRIDFDGKCESTNDLANRVDKCAEPLMDILSGKLREWPRTDEDAMALCEDFGVSERCIKDSSRKCAKGIQKTIVSTIGTSVQRLRKRECSMAKAPAIVKTTTCIEKNQISVQNWMRGVMARLNAIEMQSKTPEKKINGICCMVGDIEQEIKDILDPFCPTEARFVQRLFRGMVDNAVDIICRQPKCNDYLKGYNISKGSQFDGLIATILRIVFSMDAGD